MRNASIPKTKYIFNLAENMPYFSIDNFLLLDSSKQYLKILFSRYEKSGKLLRLKKGLYTTSNYINRSEKHNQISIFSEFTANLLYSPSYLSLDYVLYEHNLLTELPVSFTSITTKKTMKLTNDLGTYIYHTVKPDLFCGYTLEKKADFVVYKATKAKALFDYIYLRKNSLLDVNAIEELRLNLSELKTKDIKELGKYIKIENSKKMRDIFNNLVKLWK